MWGVDCGGLCDLVNSLGRNLKYGISFFCNESLLWMSEVYYYVIDDGDVCCWKEGEEVLWLKDEMIDSDVDDEMFW